MQFFSIHSFQDQRINLFYRAAFSEEDFYLIPTQQAFIQRHLVFLNWLLPVKAYKIKEEDFKRLTKQTEPKSNAVKRALGTGVGLLLARAISDAISNIVILDVMTQLLLLVSIVVIALLIQNYYHRSARSRLNKMGVSFDKPVTIKMRPARLSVKHIQILVIVIATYVFLVMSVKWFSESGDPAVLSIFILALLIFILSPAGAFLPIPSHYIFKEVKK